MKKLAVASVLSLAFLLVGCSPEVGSDAWYAYMKEKPRGEWTTNIAKDFATNCVFK
jgi:hypothetical protein